MSWIKGIVEFLMYLFIGMVFAIGVATLWAGPSKASSLTEIRDSTYKIVIIDQKGVLDTSPGLSGSCSATTVGSRKLLTAAHCFRLFTKDIYVEIVKRDPETLRIYSEHTVYLKPVKVNEAKDVAVLEPIDPDYKFPSFVDVVTPTMALNFNTLFGIPVRAFGYPLGTELMMTTGEFMGPSLIKQSPLYSRFNRASVPVEKGMSGGGLYYQVGEEWYLVGTTTGILGKNPHLAYFSLPESVVDILKEGSK